MVFTAGFLWSKIKTEITHSEPFKLVWDISFSSVSVLINICCFHMKVKSAFSLIKKLQKKYFNSYSWKGKKIFMRPNANRCR